MKKFILGALCATLIFSLSISALAISGRMTIEVSPINIQVNGETFVPKDVNGAEVPVFAYQGTTYAPLRALAEAYGLEVGYDQATNMATVVDPDAPTAPADDAKTTFGSDAGHGFDYSYEEFRALWHVQPIGQQCFVSAIDETGEEWWNSAPLEVANEYARRLASEYTSSYYFFANNVGELLYELTR